MLCCRRRRRPNLNAPRSIVLLLPKRDGAIIREDDGDEYDSLDGTGSAETTTTTTIVASIALILAAAVVVVVAAVDAVASSTSNSSSFHEIRHPPWHLC